MVARHRDCDGGLGPRRVQNYVGRASQTCVVVKSDMYRRYQGFVHSEVAPQNCELWRQHFNTFVDFC